MSTEPARKDRPFACDAIMATISTHTSPVMAPIASLPMSGIKKVFSSRRRSSDIQDTAGGSTDQFRGSVGSMSLDKSPTRMSTTSSLSRDDGSSKSGSSGMKKLVPGHAKRKRRKLREEELSKLAAEDLARGRPEDNQTLPPPSTNQSSVSLNSSLVTDDSDPDT